MEYLELMDARNEAAEQSVDDTERMRNAHYWAEELAGWMNNGRNNTKGGFHVEVCGGKAVLVLDESWEEWAADSTARGLEADGFPVSKTWTLDGETRVFVRPTSDRVVGSWTDSLSFFPRFF